MNLKSNFNLFSQKGEAQTVVPQAVSAQIISSVALSLILLTVWMQVVLADEPLASEQPGIEVLRDIDPADRKFFNPGYGVQTVLPREAEVFPAMIKAEVDPDEDIGLLEFFSLSCGAISVSKEADVLPTIDPADRKFFTPGYGVKAGGNDLTAYHQSEWDRTPNTGLGIEENALAVYHQSEWGRSPNTGLGVEALSKIDPADRKFFNPGYGAQP